jgi:hypothetical protein
LQSRQLHASAGDAEGGGPWSPNSLREKLLKVDAKVVSYGRDITFQIAEVLVSWQILAEFLANCPVAGATRTTTMKGAESVGTPARHAERDLALLNSFKSAIYS